MRRMSGRAWNVRKNIASFESQKTRQEISVQSISRPGGPTPALDDIAPWDVVVDALTYYNTKIAPDLAADGAENLYRRDISLWAETNIAKRHLTLCLVALHRAVQKYGDVKQDQALFHYHQARAAEILSHKIQKFGHTGPDPDLFDDVGLFFFSQIQTSAYGAWRAHLSAAKTLFNLWGVETLMGNESYEFILCHLVLADVFGTAMSPAARMSMEDVAQHKVYLGLLGRFNVDVCSTMVPIPEDIVRAVAAINIARAATSLEDWTVAEALPDSDGPLTSIARTLQTFNPEEWALRRPRCTTNQVSSWTLLATCFQSAAMLYFWHTSGKNFTAVNRSTNSDGQAENYKRLVDTIQTLYDLKQKGGVHFKYILWAMVINGVEAITRNDERQLRFLCEKLEQMTIDLGTLSMREAGIFLDELWTNTMTKRGETSDVYVDWDTIFVQAPLFLM
ncbi:hypothetical protein E8E13_002445 [Curvularia kusanoi]|uniref:Uncharacterized protein n=1 Tax=Curvularia kusanoi TaxID=90978 RepID=A0A9P4W4R3_CURKU|nr:hypothetical protein E8E13_002445 [Curvularia kusanoi]